MDQRTHRRAVQLFVLVLAFTALADGLGSKIFSNYFSEVFLIDSVQRGFIEVPRESPGILCMVLVAALGFLGNVWMSVIAQVLMLIGFVVMGVCSPSYGIMLVFLFIHSLGQHFFMPLSDSISMDLAENGQVGTAMGRFKGMTTLMNMVSSLMIFVGFRWAIFTFDSPVITPFVLSAVATALAAVLLCAMVPMMKGVASRIQNHKLLFRRRYMPYYMVTLAYGCQKRIRIVFAPWVIIQLLGQGADTVALLAIATHLVGTWMAPMIGRMLDRLGVRTMLWVEALYILVTFCVMGAVAGLLVSGTLIGTGWQSWLVYAAYVLCVLFEQFNMVHSVMMRSIALAPEEVTRTLSVGLGVDHVMAILASPVMGVIWEGWGAHYVFYLAAMSALFQVAAAMMVKKMPASAG